MVYSEQNPNWTTLALGIQSWPNIPSFQRLFLPLGLKKMFGCPPQLFWSRCGQVDFLFFFLDFFFQIKVKATRNYSPSISQQLFFFGLIKFTLRCISFGLIIEAFHIVESKSDFIPKVVLFFCYLPDFIEGLLRTS